MPSSTDLAPFVRSSSSSSSSSSSPSLQLRRRGLLPSPPLPSLCLLSTASSFLRSILRSSSSWLPFPSLSPSPSPRPSPPSRRLTVTFFGHRKGRISLSVQDSPRSSPLLLLELASPTSFLIKEMASGMVRILLESEHPKLKRSLWEEPLWTMFCNGQRCGYAVSRQCTPSDLQLLEAVSAVSVGAGVMTVPPPPALPSTDPAPEQPQDSNNSPPSLNRTESKGVGDGEVMYMRAKFERVVGSKDSEALYMMNPDVGGKGDPATAAAGKKSANGAPELSIFLLRV